MSTFAKVARDVEVAMSGRRDRAAPHMDPRLASLINHSARLYTDVHALVERVSGRTAAVDRDAEWQRVNSYIADVLKDTHVLFAKLARLQGDFVGEELGSLERISESVLSLGEELSQFSKAFYDGKLQMADTDLAYGSQPGQPAPQQQEVPLQVEHEGGPEGAQEQGAPQGAPQGQQGQ